MFAGRVESVDDRPRLSRRVRRPEHRDVPRQASSSTPSSQRTDAKLVFPEYTALEPKTVEDIRHVTAVEGTELTLLCRLNKDVASARLVDEKGQAIALDAATSRRPHTSTARPSRSPTRSRYRSSWSTARAGPTSSPPRSSVNVTRNRPPTSR